MDSSARQYENVPLGTKGEESFRDEIIRKVESVQALAQENLSLTERVVELLWGPEPQVAEIGLDKAQPHPGRPGLFQDLNLRLNVILAMLKETTGKLERIRHDGLG